MGIAIVLAGVNILVGLMILGSNIITAARIISDKEIEDE